MKHKDIRNVLITRFSALGDVAMTIPVVYCVCRSNPHIRFYFVTRSLPASLFVNHPPNLKVLPVNLNEYKGAGGMRRLAYELRGKYHIDAYADLHDVLRTKLLRLFMRVAGVRIFKIHKHRKAAGRLTRTRRKVMLPLSTSRAKYREVFWRMGLKRVDDFTTVFDVPASADKATPLMRPDKACFAEAAAEKRVGERWIAIAPFAQHAGKVYPLHLMEKVVETLSRRAGYKLFLMGAGPKESSTLAQWRNKYGEHVVNMAELQIGLPSEMALLYHCDLMLSMDSANMHIASLVGLRVVSIWGATHPYCGFMGWRQRREDAVQLDMMCRPCSMYGNKPCRFGDIHCLEGIPPSLVLSHIDNALK